MTPDTECSDCVRTKDPQILVETVFGPRQDSVKTPDIQCSDQVETVFGLPSDMDLSGSQWISVDLIFYLEHTLVILSYT